jgi:peroxiredoxin
MLRCALSLLAVGLMASVTFAKGIDVGDKAPDFKAIGVDGKEYTLEGAMKDADAVVVCFTCNQCPVAIAYEDRFIAFNKDFEDQKVVFVAINVNPESIEDMKSKAEEKGFNFPYAQDEAGESAKAYGAEVTPHLFVVDKEGKVAYIGAFDDNAEAADKVEHKYLEDAVKAVLKGEAPKKTKTRAVGCGIQIKKK